MMKELRSREMMFSRLGARLDGPAAAGKREYYLFYHLSPWDGPQRKETGPNISSNLTVFNWQKESKPSELEECNFSFRVRHDKGERSMSRRGKRGGGEHLIAVFVIKPFSFSIPVPVNCSWVECVETTERCI
jgi:hypothetical protein